VLGGPGVWAKNVDVTGSSMLPAYVPNREMRTLTRTARSRGLPAV
jgi:hypothetical protein